MNEIEITPYAAWPTTPRGTRVSSAIDKSGISLYNSIQKDLYHYQIQQSYPGVTLVSHANPRYNCHTYAWHSTSTSNVYWIDNPSIYMSDGSYSKRASPAVGNKVYYNNGTHSAIVYSVGSGTTSLVYISKFGSNGVYRSAASDTPYTGSQSFWTR